MALRPVVDSLEGVPEALHTEYTKRDDGKYALALEGVDLSKMQSDLGRANAEAAQRRKLLEGWERLGKTPDEIAALVAQQDEAERRKLEDKGEWEKIRNQMNEQHTAEKRALEEKLTATERRNQARLIQSEASQALAAEKGSVKVLLPHIEGHVKVVVEGEKEFVRVLDDKGDPRVKADGSFFTVSDLVKEMKSDPDYSRAFEGASGSGGGQQPGGGGNGGGSTGAKKRSEMSIPERTAYIAEHGQAAYLKLPA